MKGVEEKDPDELEATVDDIVKQLKTEKPPKKRYLSVMNVVELVAEGKKYGLELSGETMTKAQMREKIEAAKK